MGINIHIAQAAIALLFFLIVWVAIFDVGFGTIQDFFIATIVELALWAWWRTSYVKHAELLNPANGGMGGVQVVKA